VVAVIDLDRIEAHVRELFRVARQRIPIVLRYTHRMRE